jgi:hypothetical protein
MKREPIVYTLWVDGKAVQTFHRKPPKEVRELVGSAGIVITPEIVEKPNKKSAAENSDDSPKDGGGEQLSFIWGDE